MNIEHPVRIAERIQRRVRKLGVTCSVGVGTTKAIAKLASDMDKPRGLTVVYPGGEQGFLAPLPVRKLSGIGQASEAKLARLGIRTLGDLARADERMIADALGKNGVVMQMRARGAEEAAVQEDEDAKSVSNEMSFAEDLATREDIEAAVQTMAKKVGRRLRRKGLTGRTVTLKVRYADRSVRTAQTRLHEPTDDEYAMLPQLMGLLDDLWKPPMKLRLVGVAVSGFEDSAEVQDALFDWGDFAGDAPAVAEKRHAIADEKRRRGLLEATDKVKERFGEGAVQFGHDLRMGENTTGSSSKNPADYK